MNSRSKPGACEVVSNLAVGSDYDQTQAQILQAGASPGSATASASQSLATMATHTRKEHVMSNQLEPFLSALKQRGFLAQLL